MHCAAGPLAVRFPTPPPRPAAATAGGGAAAPAPARANSRSAPERIAANGGGGGSGGRSDPPPRPTAGLAAAPLAAADDATPHADAGSDGRDQGRVDRWLSEKNFGFIMLKDGERVFFHGTNAPEGPFEAGTEVDFWCGLADDGLEVALRARHRARQRARTLPHSLTMV